MQRTAQSGGGRRLLAVSLVLTVVAAIAVARFAWRDTEPDPGSTGTTENGVGAAAAAAPATASSVEDPGRGAAPRELDSAARAPAEPAIEPGTFRIELRDDGGRPVPGARVTVLNDGVEEEAADAAADGTATVSAPTDAAELARWRIVAAMPGRTVERAFLPFARPSVVTVSMGAVGALRVRCANAEFPRFRVSVRAEANGVLHGLAGSLLVDRDGATQYPVAVVSAPIEYRLQANTEFTAKARTPGPGAQGDVVDVTLDLTTCRVTGRIAGAGGEERLWAVMVEREAVHTVHVLVRSDRSFVVDLPRARDATVSFVRGRDCALLPRTSFEASTDDVGTVTFVERPRLGLLEVRDTENAIWLGSAAIRTVHTAYGTTLREGRFPVAVRCEATPERGIDVFGVPGLVAADLEPGERDAFCVPESLTLRDGVVYRAMFVPGGTVVVRVIASLGEGGHTIHLVGPTDGQRVGHAGMNVTASERRWTFRGLAPGMYRAATDGAHVVGEPIHVLAGSEQEITVTVVR